jgi:hypothetical protein
MTHTEQYCNKLNFANDWTKQAYFVQVIAHNNAEQKKTKPRFMANK